MLFGLSEATFSLILLGAFGASMGRAVLRREWSWTLALALPLLFCAAQAGLPSALVAWGCALVALGFAILLGALLLRALGLAGGATLIAMGAAMLGLSTGVANARYVDLRASSLHSPPLIGVRMEAMLRQLVRA